jgi:hypothetical protein
MKSRQCLSARVPDQLVILEQLHSKEQGDPRHEEIDRKAGCGAERQREAGAHESAVKAGHLHDCWRHPELAECIGEGDDDDCRTDNAEREWRE